VLLFLGIYDLISHAMEFFFTHFSSECISTTALKLRKVLFHILNFAHFIFKLEGELPYIRPFMVFPVLIYGLFCQLT